MSHKKEPTKVAKEECEEENSDGKVAEADKSDSDSDEEPTLSFTNPYNVSSGQPTTASTQLILYYTLGQIFVRPMGVFTGSIRDEFQITVPYILRRSNGEIQWLPYDKTNYHMLNDYNFVMENNVAPRHTTTVSIIIQDEAQAFVYGEVNQGFCFESDSMLELKGKLFIANWTDEGIVEESIGRNCLVTASEGCVVVFVCDNQEIVVLRDNTSKFVVKVIEDEITNTDRAKMGDHFVNNYRNVDEMNRRVQQYKTEDDPGQLEHHSHEPSGGKPGQGAKVNIAKSLEVTANEKSLKMLRELSEQVLKEKEKNPTKVKRPSSPEQKKTDWKLGDEVFPPRPKSELAVKTSQFMAKFNENAIQSKSSLTLIQKSLRSLERFKASQMSREEKEGVDQIGSHSSEATLDAYSSSSSLQVLSSDSLGLCKTRRRKPRRKKKKVYRDSSEELARKESAELAKAKGKLKRGEMARIQLNKPTARTQSKEKLPEAKKGESKRKCELVKEQSSGKVVGGGGGGLKSQTKAKSFQMIKSKFAIKVDNFDDGSLVKTITSRQTAMSGAGLLSSSKVGKSKSRIKQVQARSSENSPTGSKSSAIPLSPQKQSSLYRNKARVQLRQLHDELYEKLHSEEDEVDAEDVGSLKTRIAKLVTLLRVLTHLVDETDVNQLESRTSKLTHRQFQATSEPIIELIEKIGQNLDNK